MPPVQTVGLDASALSSRRPDQLSRGPISVLADVMSGAALVLITLVVSVAVGAVLVTIATTVGHWTTMLIEWL